MVSRNDITGDKIQSRIADKNFRDSFDRIFKVTSKDLAKQKQEDALQMLSDIGQELLKGHK